jgi:hypothetical protein
MSKYLRGAPDIRSILALIICLGLLGTVFAQTQNGTINGRVLDSSGAVVPAATITLTNADTGSQARVQSSGEGNYTFAGVAPGRYKIAVEKSGFGTTEESVQVAVAQRITRDVTLKAGAVATTVDVTSEAAALNTTTAEVSSTVTGKQLQTLPLLTKNPYALVGISAGAVDTAASSGDARGTGFAVNGQRTSSINYLLDGVENNETFATGPAALVPNDSVQEFKVQANNNSAEFGRNAVVTNVVTKSGTNKFHGSLSEYYRGAALTANTVQNNATNVDKPNFVRNDFTGTVGGPIIKDRTFFFLSGEGVRVRSSGNNFWWIPTQEFFNAASPGMQAYLTAAGGVPTASTGLCMTADDFGAQNGYAPGALTTASGGALAGNTPLFCQTVTSAPTDAGGGNAQNTWNATARLDHRFTDRTNLSARYAYTANNFPVGSLGADTPFSDFKSPTTFKSQNYAMTLTHAFSNTLVSENKLGFSRTVPDAPFGKASVNIPCVFFANQNGTPDASPLVFPGYAPTVCPFAGPGSGGPQNTITANSGWTLSKGKQTFKWGAYMSSLRDNHYFGAFQNAPIVIADAQNLINGIVDVSETIAIDPRGHNSGDLYDPAVDGPFGPPSFKRHYRYNEFAFYGEDSLRLTNRLTLTLGLRWEYFGVLHSPDAEKFLDANLYLDAVGVPKASNPNKTLFEQIRDARFQRTSNFFNQDWNNFGPRVGLAWDIFGNGRTAFRTGYGMYYDKNFGNALFNTIQNFPNYASLTATPDPATSNLLVANQFDTLTNIVGTGARPLRGSGRMLDRDMVTAYSQQWNAAIEHDWTGRGLITSLTYVGTKGDKLYSLNNLNPIGSCILAPAGSLPTCTPGIVSGVASNNSRLNQSGVTGLNRRGNEGFSRYHGLSGELRMQPWHGLSLQTNYTYSSSKDNISSFFGDSVYENGQFGFQNPFDPNQYYGPSTNDIKHRYLLSYNWDIPTPSAWTGLAKGILGGWSFSGVYNVQSGGAFSVYDNLNNDNACARTGGINCYPVVVGSNPSRQQTLDPTAANTYILYDFGSTYISQSQYCLNTTGAAIGSTANRACTADLYLNHPELFPQRNSFRLPGFWNWDAAIAKRFSLPREGMGLELRAELFNVLNHSNMYANIGTNDMVDTQVTGNYGGRPGLGASGVVADRRALQLGVKFTF